MAEFSDFSEYCGSAKAHLVMFTIWEKFGGIGGPPVLKIHHEMDYTRDLKPKVGIHKITYYHGALILIDRVIKRGPRKGIYPFPHLYYARGEQINNAPAFYWKGQPLALLNVDDLEQIFLDYFVKKD